MTKPLDRDAIRASLAKSQGDQGVFAGAYRDHVPVLLNAIDDALGLLLRFEWIGKFRWSGGETRGQCLDCWATENEREHTRGCGISGIDSVLTALGYPDHRSRDAERKRRLEKEHGR